MTTRRQTLELTARSKETERRSKQLAVQAERLRDRVMGTIGGWIGVDLDGTLAFYDGWKDENYIGEPITPMVERVKIWLDEGMTVKIFTARVGLSGAYSLESHRNADAEFADNQRRVIGDWCEKHIGQRLEVTASKDFAMIELWDDRCVQVIKNTGMPAALASKGA